MAFIQKLLDVFGHTANLLVIILMVAVAVGASTLGMGEEFIPLIPLFLIVSKKLGYDRVYGFVVAAAKPLSAASQTIPNPNTLS